MRSNLLTASRLRAYRDCARKHDLLYEKGLRPVREAEYFRFGSLVHSGLEARWKAIQFGAALEPQVEAVDRALRAAINGVGGWQVEEPAELVKAQEITRAYLDEWIRDEDEYEVLAVEPQFECALLNPDTMAPSRTFRLAGKIDAVLRRRATGTTIVREFKTTSEAIDSAVDSYWERLVMDPQLSIYVIGAESIGYRVDECLYDVVRKPAIRLSEVPVTDENGVKVVLSQAGERVRTKDGKKWRETGDKEAGYVLQTRLETLDEFRARLRAELDGNRPKYFQRRPIPRLNSQVQDFMFDAWQLGKQIREGELAGRAPRNPDSCLRNNQRCAFFDVCAGGIVPEQSPELFRVIPNVHPELEESNAPSL